jgi:hypothetical protein
MRNSNKWRTAFLASEASNTPGPVPHLGAGLPSADMRDDEDKFGGEKA